MESDEVGKVFVEDPLEDQVKVTIVVAVVAVVVVVVVLVVIVERRGGGGGRGSEGSEIEEFIELKTDGTLEPTASVQIVAEKENQVDDRL